MSNSQANFRRRRIPVRLGVSRKGPGHIVGLKNVIQSPLPEPRTVVRTPRRVVRTPQGVIKLVATKRNILAQCKTKSPKFLPPGVREKGESTMLPIYRKSTQVAVNSRSFISSPLVPLEEYDKFEKELSKKGLLHGIGKYCIPLGSFGLKQNVKFNPIPSCIRKENNFVQTANKNSDVHYETSIPKVPDSPKIIFWNKDRFSVVSDRCNAVADKPMESGERVGSNSAHLFQSLQQEEHELNQNKDLFSRTTNSFLPLNHTSSNHNNTIKTQCISLPEQEIKLQSKSEGENTEVILGTEYDCENKFTLVDNSFTNKLACKVNCDVSRNFSRDKVEQKYTECFHTQEKNSSQLQNSGSVENVNLEQQELSILKHPRDLQKKEIDFIKCQADLYRQEEQLYRQQADLYVQHADLFRQQTDLWNQLANLKKQIIIKQQICPTENPNDLANIWPEMLESRVETNCNPIKMQENRYAVCMTPEATNISPLPTKIRRSSRLSKKLRQSIQVIHNNNHL